MRNRVGSLEAGGDRLSNRHIARNHGAVDGRDDACIVQIDLRGIERRLMLLDCGLVIRNLGYGLVVGVLGIIERVLRNGVRLQQVCITIDGDLCIGEVGLVLFERCFRNGQVCLVLINDGLIGTRIYRGADLSFLNLSIVVAIEFLDDP